ncbi:MAG: hypothetical protein ACLVL7_04715 [Anaerotruncus massiliensis (ex Togo et al. 2019)]
MSGLRKPVEKHRRRSTPPVWSLHHGQVYDIIVSKSSSPEDRVLLIDDFLAKGSALNGLCQLVEIRARRLWARAS